MPTWVDIDTNDFENFKIEFNRTMKYFTSRLGSQNVKRLDTNETVIKSADGETQISGPLLLMYDKQNPAVLRLKMGYDAATSKFVFNMYDNSGNLTLTLNDLGVAKFSGSIETTQDATVGKNLYIGNTGDVGVSKFLIFASMIGLMSEPDEDLSQGPSDIWTRLRLLCSSLMLPDTIHLGGSVVGPTSGTSFLGDFEFGGDVFKVTTGEFGVFGSTATQQTAALLTRQTTQTAGVTYTGNEQTMLANLKADVTQLTNTVNGLINKLGLYGLFDVV
jgi:hypothetical protein